ncbi:IclR family transcriptional regulator C-terminal domain-containing protein [Lentisphaerota bacterium WC36G]|nr:helix-turn-helix domain-containing protein [Lentisphaerae bacterium WC36]
MNNKQLIEVALDVLNNIEKEIGETIGLGTLNESKDSGSVLTYVQGTSGFCYHLDIGFKFPLHTSAPGKVILAYLPEDELDECLSKMDFTKFTKNTITSKSEFKTKLEYIKQRGYSFEMSEQIAGCNCVGVAVFDKNEYPVAAIWATAPATSLPQAKFEKIYSVLKKGANEISLALGGGKSDSRRQYIEDVLEKAEKILRESSKSIVNMEELAKSFHVSYSWFRRAFKQKTSMSPNQYHLKYRIENIKNTLVTTNDSLKKIAEKYDFSSQYHLSTLFKSKVGISPEQYRKQHNED